MLLISKCDKQEWAIFINGTYMWMENRLPTLQIHCESIWGPNESRLMDLLLIISEVIKGLPRHFVSSLNLNSWLGLRWFSSSSGAAVWLQ